MIYYWTDARQHGIYLLNGCTRQVAKHERSVRDVGHYFGNNVCQKICFVSISTHVSVRPWANSRSWINQSERALCFSYVIKPNGKSCQKCSVRNMRICAVFRNKRRDNSALRSLFSLSGAFYELMRVLVRSWQPIIEALSKRLCIITHDLTFLQLFWTGSKCPKNIRHSGQSVCRLSLYYNYSKSSSVDSVSYRFVSTDSSGVDLSHLQFRR